MTWSWAGSRPSGTHLAPLSTILMTRFTDLNPMRLDPQHVAAIKRLAAVQFGAGVRVRLFGSRVDDAARGGDVDLLVEVDEPIPEPAMAGARFSVQISRLMSGRKVDVVLAAPNLMTAPIHEVARRTGILL